MVNETEKYQFVNVRTGNVIGYLSLPAGEEKITLLKKLEQKRNELAVKIGSYFGHIYWRRQDLA
jgi:hypothetical protein